MIPKPYFNSKGEVLSLIDYMRLKKISDWSYESTTKAYEPTGGANGAYGGFIYALSAWAAAQTVQAGLTIHSISGNFILGGIPSETFKLDISKIRDGGNYSSRYVTATQSKGICFTALVSFKRPEKSRVEMQDKVDIHKQFAVALRHAHTPFDHPESPSMGSQWFAEVYLPTHPEHYNPLPALHLRQANMSTYNSSLKPIDRRSLAFYSLRGKIPRTSEYANLHAIAHLFASDRNSLFVIPRHLGVGMELKRTASLSHTVIFHVHLDQMLMGDEPPGRNSKSPPTENWGDGEADEEGRKWYVQESWMTRAGGGRGLHHSRIWEPETGVHVATTIQDGLVRFAERREVKL
ncbi:hypothetical protein AC579_5261 [Pseudocercospora musae]|uniref:Acyl-CoA thioesterase-like N-terminal HotDog domain-containing protein n=1 Tax=Pseudocercospora musae TaxID=113226 RepID=A0A139IQ72_9PEZI|nr:hypothetical protein AC579_5261 [Pseudocercospora musae]